MVARAVAAVDDALADAAASAEPGAFTAAYLDITIPATPGDGARDRHKAPVAALAAVGVDRLTRPGRVRLLAPSLILLMMLIASAVILVVTYRPAFAESWRWTQSEHRDKFAWLGAQVATGSAINTALFVAALAASGGAARSANVGARARCAAILPVLAMMIFLLGFHGKDLDLNYSARPLAEEIARTAPDVKLVATEDVRRDLDYGLAFYRNQPLLHYGTEGVPDAEHILVIRAADTAALEHYLAGRVYKPLFLYDVQGLAVYRVEAKRGDLQG